MRTVAIALCDNDFGSMFRPLLDSIAQVINWREDITREEVTALVLAGLNYHYLAHQGRHEQTEDERATAVEYLTDRVEVLFDEEAEAACVLDHDGGSWWLDVKTGRVTAY